MTASPALARGRADRLEVLGWNNACSVALAHYAYSPGSASDDPRAARVGALTLAPGGSRQKSEWLFSAEGYDAWRPREIAAAIGKLKARGYGHAGSVETVRPDPVADEPGLERLLRSSAVFSLDAAAPWPAGARLAEVRYSPLMTCGLFVFERDADALYLLARIGNAQARAQRARAHVSNALALLDGGDAPGALAETAIAARMAPENAVARYHHASVLCLNGFLPEALDELKEAAARDGFYRKAARGDRNFESLFDDARFKALTRP